MMAGHSLHKLQLVLYAHWQEKQNPLIQVLKGASIHNPLMLTKYTVFQDTSLRQGAWKSQAASGSGNADVWQIVVGADAYICRLLHN